MNILLISVVFPYPADNGGSSGMHKLIEGLRQVHTITLVCPSSSLENTKALTLLWPNVDIVPFSMPSGSVNNFSLKSLIKSFGNTKKPTKAQLFRQAMVLQTTNLTNFHFNDLIEIVKGQVAQKQFDVAQVEFIELAPIINFLPKGLKTVFVHHEIRHRRMRLELATLPSVDNADIWKIENTKILEIGLLNLFDKVVCLTPHDKQYLIEDGVSAHKLEVSSLPAHFIDHNINNPFIFKNRLVFLGPEIHFPNLDAIDWFLDNCWKELQKKHPNLSFDIIGKWSLKTIESYKKYKNVNFVGFVPELEEIMTGVIMVVPLRIGSGMRMKILEGVSWHVPIISTTIGAEGLPMNNGENCFISDTSLEFINSVSEVIESIDLQKQFIEKSRSLIFAGFSVEECTNARNQIFESVFCTN
jgi:glycosyltransferase involved in cell wall biosynthesis